MGNRGRLELRVLDEPLGRARGEGAPRRGAPTQLAQGPQEARRSPSTRRTSTGRALRPHEGAARGRCGDDAGDGQFEPSGLVTSTAAAYFAMYTNGRVVAMSLDGGAPGRSSPQSTNPWGIAIDTGQRLLGERYGNGGPRASRRRGRRHAGDRSDAAGRHRRTQKGSSTGQATREAPIQRMPADGGAPTVLVSGQSKPSAIVLDAISTSTGRRTSSVMEAPHLRGEPRRARGQPGAPVGPHGRQRQCVLHVQPGRDCKESREVAAHGRRPLRQPCHVLDDDTPGSPARASVRSSRE